MLGELALEREATKQAKAETKDVQAQVVRLQQQLMKTEDTFALE